MNLTASSVWSKCLKFIKDNIQSQAYKTWFEPIKAVKLDDNVLSVEVPSKFFYEWLEEHYVKILKVALQKTLGENAKLVYVIKMQNTYGNSQPYTEKIPSSGAAEIKAQNATRPLSKNVPELKNPFVIPGIKNVKIESQLNPNYSFENFLEGDSNRLARNAGIAVANKPGGTSFNPFLVFGGVGLGKTHLANAIGIDIKNKYPEKTVLYTTAEKFTQQYIESVKKNNRNDFIYFYQIIDVLIIDDDLYYVLNSNLYEFNGLHSTLLIEGKNYGGNISSIFLDREKNIWICTGNGVLKVENSPFYHYSKNHNFMLTF